MSESWVPSYADQVDHDCDYDDMTTSSKGWRQPPAEDNDDATFTTQALLKNMNPLATLNHYLLQFVEQVVSSCLVSSFDCKPNHKHSYQDTITACRRCWQPREINDDATTTTVMDSKEILRDMQQRLAMGLLMVAELTLKWNQRTATSRMSATSYSNTGGDGVDDLKDAFLSSKDSPPLNMVSKPQCTTVPNDVQNIKAKPWPSSESIAKRNPSITH